MKKTSSRTSKQPQKPVEAPTGHYQGRPKHVLDLTVFFGGEFVHSPVARYKNGASIDFTGVSAIHCGEKALKDMCTGFGVHGVRRFFKFENECFVLLASERDYMKLWSRALVEGQKVVVYADLEVEMIATGGGEAVGEKSVEEEQGGDNEMDIDEDELGENVETNVEVDTNVEHVVVEDYVDSEEEVLVEEYVESEEEVLAEEQFDEQRIESPVQFLGETVNGELVDGGDGQNDDELFEINVTEAQDMGTQTQPEVENPIEVTVVEEELEKEEKKIGKAKKKGGDDDELLEEEMEKEKKRKGKGKVTGGDDDELWDSDYDYSTPSDSDDSYEGEECEEEEEADEEEEIGLEFEEEELVSSKKEGSSKRSRYQPTEVGDDGEENICEDNTGWSSSDEDETVVKKKKKKNIVKSKTFQQEDVFTPEFELGTCFTSKLLFREAVHSHALKTKRKLKIYPNDAKRMHVKCHGVPPCEFKIHTIKSATDDAFKVREYFPIHYCNETAKITNIKSTWLAKKYLSSFACDPKRDVKGLKKEIKRDHGINVSRQSIYRMKKMAHKILYGTETEQIGLLPDYQHEVLSKNPGTTFLLDVDGETGKFQRLYVCLDACKKGFVACRRIVGVDGCHLNGEFGGVLLTAVGVDPNNNTYPIAWAVVQSETFESWSWFLSILEVDLHMQDHEQWTWISDKQKGLIKAFDQNFKESTNRFCVKHLHGNMKKAGFTGNATKEALWNLATATTMAQYQRRLEELENLNPGAAAWLHDKAESDYCRAFFNTEVKCDMLLNNGCESFNGTILDARELGLIWMCEWLMTYVMSRFQKNRDLCAKRWNNKKICPRIRQIVDKNISHRAGLETLMSDRYNWAVEVLSTGDKYAVDLKKKTCGCRKWDLTGVPCRHALCCILENEWDPEMFVHECYHVKTYMKVYAPVVYPINGKNEWIRTGLPKPLPPNEGRDSGRPETCRRRQPDEPALKKRKCRGGGPATVSSKSQYKLKKEQRTVICGYCNEEGHNSKGCAIKKANEAAGEMLYEAKGKRANEFTFNKAAKEDGTAPGKEKEPTGGEQEQSKSKTKPKKKPVKTKPLIDVPVQGEASSFPSMTEQLKHQGVLPKNHTKTINVDGATVHMRTRPDNVILGSSLVAMKDKKKGRKKKNSGVDI